MKKNLLCLILCISPLMSYVAYSQTVTGIDRASVLLAQSQSPEQQELEGIEKLLTSQKWQFDGKGGSLGGPNSATNPNNGTDNIFCKTANENYEKLQFKLDPKREIIISCGAKEQAKTFSWSLSQSKASDLILKINNKEYIVRPKKDNDRDFIKLIEPKIRTTEIQPYRVYESIK